jgi:hypothetical protein
MINTFADKPDFIVNDPRINRPMTWQYTVSADLMTTRHELFFHKTDLTGKRVLDLGSCCGATGAWVLDRGASHYTGVELQNKFVETSRTALGKYYSPAQWTVVASGVEEYLDSCTEKFDVVIMVGVLHCLFDYQHVLERISEISNEVIIECFHPYNAFKDLFPALDNTALYNLCKTTSLAQIATKTGTAGENGGSYNFDGVRLSMLGLANVFGYLGWSTDLAFNDVCIEKLPDVYSLDTPSYCPRYVTRSVADKRTVFEFADGYRDPEKTNYEYKNW